MQKNYNYRATMLLIVFAVGFLISYPFNDNFIGGLISSACCAATIGGLADWFAVTAIFKKPLGINWPRNIFRTEIIPKNRENIFNGLVNMVQDELLSKENIKNKIEELDISYELTEYLSAEENRNCISEVLSIVVNDALSKIDNSKIKYAVESILNEGIQSIKLHSLIDNFIHYIMSNQHNDKFINVCIDESVRFMKSNSVNDILSIFVQNVIKEYENDAKTRKFTDMLVMNFILKMDPVDIASIIQKRMCKSITDIKDSSDLTRERIKTLIDNLRDKLQNDTQIQGKLEIWKKKHIVVLNQLLNNLLDIYLLQINGNMQYAENKINNVIKEKLNSILEKCENNKVYKSKMDMILKNMLIKLLENKHDEIGFIVRDKLNEFSNQDLVNLIEKNTGNDLQLIRINGSLVGGLVGIATYLITYLIK